MSVDFVFIIAAVLDAQVNTLVLRKSLFVTWVTGHSNSDVRGKIIWNESLSNYGNKWEHGWVVDVTRIPRKHPRKSDI